MRIVWHAEGIHRQISDLKAFTRGEEPEIQPDFELLFDGLAGEAIAINRNLQLGGQSDEPLSVI